VTGTATPRTAPATRPRHARQRPVAASDDEKLREARRALCDALRGELARLEADAAELAAVLVRLYLGPPPAPKPKPPARLHAILNE
jgi:hypothetical protein